MEAKGVILKESRFSVKETTDRIYGFLMKNGITVYARIDQQSEVGKKGIGIKPLEFLLFGNPLKGGNIIAFNPLAAIDLPLKLIVWQDDNRKVWVAYNDALYLKNRFGLSDGLARLADLSQVVQMALQ
ncbi:MAG: DUF302 domain-containing protein [Bacteroidota bacterium]